MASKKEQHNDVFELPSTQAKQASVKTGTAVSSADTQEEVKDVLVKEETIEYSSKSGKSCGKKRTCATSSKDVKKPVKIKSETSPGTSKQASNRSKKSMAATSNPLPPAPSLKGPLKVGFVGNSDSETEDLIEFKNAPDECDWDSDDTVILSQDEF